MANVNLPNTDGMTTMDELRNAVGKMTKELSWLLTNLDTRNVNELNAEVIIAESITGDKIQAGAITAEKITVDELSAITANLGHITAGLIESIRIFGSYIATRNGAFPRAELNNVGDLLAVYTDANNSVVIKPGITNTPNLVFTEAGVQVGFIGPAFGLLGFQGNESMVIGTDIGTLTLKAGSYVSVPSWDKLVNSSTGYSLQDELDSLRSEIAGKADISHSHTVNLGTHNHGIAGAVNWGGTFTVS